VNAFSDTGGVAGRHQAGLAQRVADIGHGAGALGAERLDQLALAGFIHQLANDLVGQAHRTGEIADRLPHLQMHHAQHQIHHQARADFA